MERNVTLRHLSKRCSHGADILKGILKEIP